jgi:hypothetical protein
MRCPYRLGGWRSHDAGNARPAAEWFALHGRGAAPNDAEIMCSGTLDE